MLGADDEQDFGRDLWRRRKQRRMTQRELAERMAYDRSRVSQVESGETPHEDFARQADLVLGAGGELLALHRRLAAARDDREMPPVHERELGTTDFIAWLADHADVDFRSLYGAVDDAVRRLEAEPLSVRYGRERSRAGANRAALVGALVGLYGSESFYRARIGPTEVVTSVATRPAWITDVVDLGGGATEFRYVQPAAGEPTPLDGSVVAAAVARLADAELNGTVMVNNPLYRLLDIDLGAGRLSATMTTVDFARHAMTTELMEGELVDAVTTGTGRLPLRETFLPDLGSAFDPGGRFCVGGLAAVLAIARSPRHGGDRDYVTLTQERSKSVLNTAGRLATIPKAFHQPTAEPTDEASIAVTLRREFEEELLGRDDLEQLSRSGRPHVDLLHPQNLTEPMAWLLDRGPETYRIECTGFGFNLVTGNYEFACLIVIDDESWWDRFGHLVEANWEADRIHRLSSLDTAGIESLTLDPRWGNESLFAYLQGLRRLAQVGDPARTAIPPIELEV